jgi:hypothetical protein
VAHGLAGGPGGGEKVQPSPGPGILSGWLTPLWQVVRETHQDPAVVKVLNECFIPIRLEGRGHMDLVRQFQVTGAPTTLLFSPDGEEKHRFAGFQTAEEYLRELEKGG